MPDHTGLYGDIKTFASIRGRGDFTLYGCSNVYGNISALANKPLVYISVHDTQISGPIDSLSNLTTLEGLHCANTPVSGSLNGLSNLTKLNRLLVNNTNKPGIF